MAARSWIIECPRHNRGHNRVVGLTLLGLVVGGGCGRTGTAVYPVAGHVQSADGRHRAIVVQTVNTSRVPLRDHHHILDVHPRYARYETSGLECQVEPRRDNDLELVVEPAPGRP